MDKLNRRVIERIISSIVLKSARIGPVEEIKYNTTDMLVYSAKQDQIM